MGVPPIYPNIMEPPPHWWITIKCWNILQLATGQHERYQGGPTIHADPFLDWMVHTRNVKDVTAEVWSPQETGQPLDHVLHLVLSI